MDDRRLPNPRRRRRTASESAAATGAPGKAAAAAKGAMLPRLRRSSESNHDAAYPSPQSGRLPAFVHEFLKTAPEPAALRRTQSAGAASRIGSATSRRHLSRNGGTLGLGSTASER